MKGTILYQICIEGRYKNFEQTNKYLSKEVYTETPTQTKIDEFVTKCCDSGDIYSLYDLDKGTITIKIHKLIIS
jgi:hypothetical protein